MKIKTFLEPGVKNIIGTEINYKNDLVGKIVEYNILTGEAMISITSDDFIIVSKEIFEYSLASSKQNN